jgi:hypothetical protein
MKDPLAIKQVKEIELPSFKEGVKLAGKLIIVGIGLSLVNPILNSFKK